MLDDGGSASLFESVIGGEKVGRYSFIAVSPVQRFSARGNLVTVEVPGGAKETFTAADPLAALKERISVRHVADIPGLPPFIGGAIGYAAYDVVRYVERLPNAPPDDRQLPDLDFSFYDSVVVFDNVQKSITVVVLADMQRGPNATDVYAKACQRVDELVGRLSRPVPPLSAADLDVRPAAPLEIKSNFTKAEFLPSGRKVHRVHSRGRYLPGGTKPAVHRGNFGIAPGDLSQLASGEPQSVHVLFAYAGMHVGRVFAGNHVPRRRWSGHGATARRYTSAW